MRSVTLDELVMLVGQSDRDGRCPSCGAEVEQFGTLYTPDGEMAVGCVECGLNEAVDRAVLRSAAVAGRR